MFHLNIWLLGLSAAMASAAIETVFTLGADDNDVAPFSIESFTAEPAPGSPTLKDDHFYLNLNEPIANFERAITSSDPTNIIYFDLTTAQANPDGIFRFTIDFMWSGTSGTDPVSNILTVKLNGNTFFTSPSFEAYQTFTAQVTATTASVITGINTLEVTRSGGSPNSWLSIDYLQLEVDPTAAEDKDNDNLPLYWETLYQLSDNDPADAAANFDSDLLTNLQEFNANTNPRLADTDHDLVLDHLEITTDPLDPDSDDDGLLDGKETNSNPALVDTDSDGAPDGWEIATGFNPNSNTSTPPAFSGAIGINFRSAEQDTRGIWPTNAVNGFIPQYNWNQTILLRQWGVSTGDPLLTGSTTDIASPIEDTLVNSAGNPLTTTIDFTFDGCWTSSNHDSLPADLLNGYFRSDETHNPTITLNNIPFSNYDIYLYVASDYLGPTGTARLNSNPATDVTLRPNGVSPVAEFIPTKQTAGLNAPLYNTIRFSGLTGTSQVIEYLQVNGNSGPAAIQIVDTDADADNDLLPDYWEFLHQTNAALPNATADPDSDGLNHLAEFNRGTNPHLEDTDGDGLSDLVETNSGTYTDANNTGTNPLYADTDGDGLSDSEEITGTFFSNPLFTDTDNDTFDDHLEATNNVDPNNNAIGAPPVPTFPTPASLFWEITDIQIVRNHSGALITYSAADRYLLTVSVTNGASPGWRPLEFGFIENGGDSHAIYVIGRANGGFSYTNGNGLWAADYSDLTAALGFSGYGPCDISDPLTVRLSASGTANVTSGWTVTYEVINQATSTTIFSHTFTNAVADQTIADGTATWQNGAGTTNFAELDTGTGVEVYLATSPLTSLPAFASHADNDDDGMPNVWEITHSLNPNNPADATLDLDSDNLINRDEFLLGTDPNDADSDDDFVNDDEEINLFSNPNDPNSTPAHFFSALTYDDDLDNNGLPDAWEAAFNAFGLLPGNDDDNDGFTNTEEAQAGTDPLDPDSKPQIEITFTTPTFYDLTWPHVPGKNQTPRYSTDLDDWYDVPVPPLTTDGTSRLSFGIVGTQQFYRVRTTDQNSDSDPLNDWTELALGLSPDSPNSSARPLSYDSNADGVGDTTLPGDLVAWHNTFANSLNLAAGNNVVAPTPYDASRLLMQASFGPTMPAIDTVRSMGIEGWLDDQINNQPATTFQPYYDEIESDFFGPRTDLSYSYNEMSDFLNGDNINTPFARAAISNPDQLRQRVAFALSQLTVISRRDANLTNRPIALFSFYDLLLEHAFGNFEDFMLAVTLHPAMGTYLSHVGNQPPDPSINRYPDENYAREVMQLFMIGLWELNNDGSRKKAINGDDIPTYSNTEITELARVLTGLWYGGNPWASGGWQDIDFAVPMEMHADYHDFNEKTLLNGFTIPKRFPSQANGLLDIQDAIRHLFEHGNCPPFVSKSLIQFLVTSNPTPAYVERIANVFINDGTGTRGNLAAVVKAILMDPEARDPAIANSENFGLLREPVIRTMHLARLSRLNQNNDLVWWGYDAYYNNAFQQPLFSPSVFNFFGPDYSPPGTLTEAGLAGPAFEITNSFTAVSFPNQLWSYADEGISLWDVYSDPADYSALLPYANDHDTLLDYVNLLACAGHMSAETRATIKSSLDATDANDQPGKVKLALYLALMSPNGAIQR